MEEPTDAEFKVIRAADPEPRLQKRRGFEVLDLQPKADWGEALFVAAVCIGLGLLWRLYVHPWWASHFTPWLKHLMFG